MQNKSKSWKKIMKKYLNDKKFVWAFCFNFLIVVFEILGLIFSVQKHGIRVFKYYTENSNYFTLLVSIVFCVACIFAIKNKTKIPAWIIKLRFVSTICLTITYVVVTLVLIPLYPASFIYMMFGDSNLYQHLLCPILSIISFLFFESTTIISKQFVFLALIPTLTYGIISIILNLLNIMAGPYPFFYVYDIPWFVIILSILGILLLSVVISYVLYKSFNYIYLKAKN